MLPPPRLRVSPGGAPGSGFLGLAAPVEGPKWEEGDGDSGAQAGSSRAPPREAALEVRVQLLGWVMGQRQAA